MTARTLSDGVSDEWRAFWTERHVCLLTTLRRNGTPHVVAVNATLDVEEGIARVMCSAGSQKERNVAAWADRGGARVALTQIEPGRWSTLEGLAVVRPEADVVRDAEERYTVRYQVPRVNPKRVVLEIAVDRVLGLP
ncbi:pyridoxamine 5'-phosphate oxidase family protein [Pseudonocardia endophytica]|uniref:PPOX class probable F420-dependent enzyme n=1 Tax=Pseudonocardia endophytica TaxID=401976 RepID=A0A4R1HX24_PSEEN|nr:pyridoxamine 5'-phosphate oxidase family protein [Pseudonocardia endophytica]TCK26043.1 PPOX class probable F420-dependent enzyme [Pseudonocardia endophytica]